MDGTDLVGQPEADAARNCRRTSTRWLVPLAFVSRHPFRWLNRQRSSRRQTFSSAAVRSTKLCSACAIRKRTALCGCPRTTERGSGTSVCVDTVPPIIVAGDTVALTLTGNPCRGSSCFASFCCTARMDCRSSSGICPAANRRRMCRQDSRYACMSRSLRTFNAWRTRSFGSMGGLRCERREGDRLPKRRESQPRRGSLLCSRTLERRRGRKLGRQPVSNTGASAAPVAVAVCCTTRRSSA